MKEIGLIGGGFHHDNSSTANKIPKYFTYAKNKIKDITIYVDEGIFTGLKTPNDHIKIAWIVESSGIIPQIVESIKLNYKEVSNQYTYLFTNDESILSLADNFHYMPVTGYWIKDPKIHSKDRLCSMVCSNKNMCDGHAYRLYWANKLKNKLDLFGRGIRDFEKKEDVLSDYMFSVTMENSKYNSYWSEKILDCFLCGTIPIYHGAGNIGDFFVEDGIIELNDTFDVSNLSPELYLSKEDAIIENYNRALKYNCIEDIMWENYLIKL